MIQLKTKIFILIGIPVLLIFVILMFISLPWLLIFTGIQFSPNPPSPQVKYGEFPIHLVYEIDGQRKEIKDTLICEYDGIGANEGHGKYRKWKAHLASENEKLVLLNVEKPIGIVFSRIKTLNQVIYYDPGPAWYYMGDGNGYTHEFPNASFKEQYQDGSGANGIIQANELLEKCNIKLISWDYTEPIINNFTSKK
ncbi:hypothetical protein PASE110613_17130 [Paenibacillus sediminis]|uniref:Uncharacterized protein n=1 Tax=Paenibacillus sediminis TaxID=664909 RepID=A0ABS4H491_9BACL|nr:hypothetical protein [Paenibacillus sediminis]MBP1936925.1 hypothetical protein [Paenibacillus sediminis]